MLGGPFAHFCVPECVSSQVRVQFSNDRVKGDVVADNERSTEGERGRDQRGASRPDRGSDNGSSSADRGSSRGADGDRSAPRSAPRRDSAPTRDGAGRGDRETRPYRGTGSSSSEGGAPRRDGPPRRDSGPRRDSPPRGESDRRGGGPSRGPRDGGGYKGDREERAPRRERDGGDARPQQTRMDVPDVPEDVTGQALDRDAHGRLRTLSKDNAEDVARHLVMAGRLIDDDPELAYRHAQVALARGGRVDVVREAAALTAYATGRYAEALREFRTVTRLSGSHEHLALVADCERGLGRPEKALEIAQSADAKGLDPMSRAELDLVVAGARADLQQFDAALLALDRIKAVDADQAKRVDEARSVIRVAAGLDATGELPGETASGSALVEGELASTVDVDEVEVIVYDLEDDADA